MFRTQSVAAFELVAGQQYVIGSAMASSPSPTFSATGANPALTMLQGRVASGGSGVLVYPSGASGSFFGGANFLFLPVTP
jgi:hypothetical protein